MKRYTVIKNFITALKDNDVAIFSGQEMCKEAYQYDRPGNFYIDEPYGVAAAFALGMAMCTDKRIFVFIGEGDLLRELAVAAQLSASRCENIYLIVLDNGVYQSVDKLPNIMSSMTSKRGVMYNLGLTVFDFTVYTRRGEFDKMKSFMKNLRGPMVIFFDIDTGVRHSLPVIEISKEDQIKRVTELLKNKEIGTSLPVINGPTLNAREVKPEVLTNGL